MVDLRHTRVLDTTADWNTGTYSQTTESDGSVQLAEAPATFEYSLESSDTAVEAAVELRDADTGTVLHAESATDSSANGEWVVDTFQHPNLEAYATITDSSTVHLGSAELLKPDGSVFASVSTTGAETGSPSETAVDTFGYYDTGSYTAADWTPSSASTPTLTLLAADVTYANPSQEITVTVSNGSTSENITLSDGANTYSVDLLAGETYSVTVAFTRGDIGNETPVLNSLTTHAFNEPLNVDAVNASGRDNDITWDALSGASGYRVYRAVDSGSTLTDYSQVADVTTAEYTDSAPLDGTQYHYVVTGYDNVGESPPSTEDTATTDLPDEDSPLIRTDVEDQLTVDRESAVSNAGNVRIQIRETGETTWDNTAVGFAEQLIPYDDLTAVFGGLEDGEKYDIRARTETQDVIGEYVTLTAITLLPVPANPRISSVGRTSLGVAWDDESDNEDGFRVEYRTSGGSYSTATTTNPNVESATVGSLAEDTTYEIRVVAFTEHVEATSTTVESTTITGSYSITVDSPVKQDVVGYGDTAAFGLDLRYNASHTATIEIPEGAEGAGDLRLGDTEITYRGSTLLEGTVLQSRPLEGATTELEVEGPAWNLKRQGPEGTEVPVTYSNLPVADAVRQYASLRGLDVTVYDPPTSIQADNDIIASTGPFTFESVFNIQDSDPVVWDGSNFMRPARTCVVDAQSGGWSGGDTVVDTSGEYISGLYKEIEGSNLETTETSIAVDYDLPADRVGIAVSAHVSGGGTAGSSVFFNGETFDGPIINTTNPGADWYTWESYSGDDLVAGQENTINASVDGGVDYQIDAFAVYDTKYPPDNWDEPGSDGLMAGPEWYPETVELSLDEEQQAWPIREVSIDATVDDTTDTYGYTGATPAGSVAVSNQADAVLDYRASDLYTTRTTITLSFGGVDDESAAEDLGPKPTLRNTPQEVTSFEARITTDNTPIINQIELDGNDFENLRNLVESGGLRFVTDPTSETPSLEVFSPGDPSVAKNLDDVDILTEPLPEYNLTGYANRARVTNPQTGETSAVEDVNEVDEYGRIEAPPVYANLSGDAQNVRAQQEVLKRSNNDQPETSIRAMPALVLPGYPYEFDFGMAALDNVRYSVSAPDSAEMNLEFGQPDTPVQKLIETRRNLQS